MRPVVNATTINALRLGLGSAELTFPELTARRLVTKPIEGHAPTVIRVLGVRQVLQALITASRPAGRVLALGVTVDVIHAATMAVLALLCRPWRRAALVEAVVATGLAAAGASALSRVSDRTIRVASEAGTV